VLQALNKQMGRMRILRPFSFSASKRFLCQLEAAKTERNLSTMVETPIGAIPERHVFLFLQCRQESDIGTTGNDNLKVTHCDHAKMTHPCFS